MEIIYDKTLYDSFKPAKEGDAGFDLRSAHTFALCPGASVKVSSGVKLEVPANHVGLVFPRSGSGSKGLVLGNLTGVVDSGYRGDITLTLWNRSDEIIEVKRGDRVAQILFVPVTVPVFDLVDEFTEATERGESGFGSTGK